MSPSFEPVRRVRSALAIRETLKSLEGPASDGSATALAVDHHAKNLPDGHLYHARARGRRGI